jgi:hypothetical protein
MSAAFIIAFIRSAPVSLSVNHIKSGIIKRSELWQTKVLLKAPNSGIDSYGLKSKSMEYLLATLGTTK